MKLLFTNVQVLDSSSAHHGKVVNIAIENGKIAGIGKKETGKKTIDAKGLVVTPGWVDLFAHFNEPGFEHKEDIASGKRTAQAAGFTDVCLIPNTFPPVTSKSDVSFIKSRSGPEVNLHALAALSEDLKGENLTEILDLQAAGAVAFTDGLLPVWNSELLLKALQYVQKFDGLVITRPKDVHLAQFSHMHEGIMSTSLGLKGEPSLSEEIAIKRDLDILRYTNGRIHFAHLSTAGGVELIKAAKKEGLRVTCDVAIHQLLYTEEDLGSFDSNFKVDPPFRSEKDRKALINGLKSGVIDAIVSSHQPQDPENKDLEFDLSATGICSLPTLYADLLQIQNELPIEVAIERLTQGPRKVLRLPEVKVETGFPARLSFFDPGLEWVFDHKQNPSRSQNSPRFGDRLIGRCMGTVNGDHTAFPK